jgi:hypothetical protein
MNGFWAGRVGGFMEKNRPWQPRVDNLPLFNPFESSTEWTEQLGDGDRIEIEDEEVTEDDAPADPAAKESDGK